MTLDINTKVSGQFDIYRITRDGKKILERSVPNLITNAGLNAAATSRWADCFTHLVLGTGTAAAANTDTALQTPIAGVLINTYSGNTGDNGTTGSYNGSTGSTSYVLKRTFIYTHNTTTTTINEVGLRSLDSATLFNRATISPGVTVANGDILAITYNFTIATDGTRDFNINLFKDGSAIAGSGGAGHTVITTYPYSIINANGTTGANNDFSIFEPSVTIGALGIFGSTAQVSAQTNRRTAFTTTPTILSPNPRYVSTTVSGTNNRNHSIPQLRNIGTFTVPVAYSSGSYQIHKQLVHTFGSQNGNNTLNQLAIVGNNLAESITVNGSSIHDYGGITNVPNGTEFPDVPLGRAAGGLQWFIGSSGAGTSVLTTDKIRIVLRLSWNRS